MALLFLIKQSQSWPKASVAVMRSVFNDWVIWKPLLLRVAEAGEWRGKRDDVAGMNRLQVFQSQVSK